MTHCASCKGPADLRLPVDWNGWNENNPGHICRRCLRDDMEYGHRHVHDHTEDCTVETVTVDGEAYVYTCPEPCPVGFNDEGWEIVGTGGNCTAREWTGKNGVTYYITDGMGHAPDADEPAFLFFFNGKDDVEIGTFPNANEAEQAAIRHSS